jgi:FtsP/CotA-like multicopper oxidase with cupredoxin domain
MFLNDAGNIGLTLNGKSFPATAPIKTKLGDWIQIDYFNEGLPVHPMHLHGVPQLVIAKDGFPASTPYFADTVLVSPGERYSVLVHATNPGVWAFPATSSLMPNPTTGCSAWSRRSSSSRRFKNPSAAPHQRPLPSAPR